MRVAVLGIAALCAPVVFAVPHGAGNHHHGHPPRPSRRGFEPGYSTVTDVVTVIVVDAIVWVDQFNNVLSTESHGQVTPTTLPPDTDTHSSPPSVLTTAAFSSSIEPSIEPSSDKGDNNSNNGDNSNIEDDSNSAGAGGGFGICYELIGTNGGCKPQSQMNTEFPYLASQGVSKIRFYDIGCDLSVATAAAAAAGFSVTLGLNTIGNVENDLTTLINMIKGNWGPIDTVVVGNEVIGQGGSPDQIVAAVNSARGQLQSAGFTKDVVAVDTFVAHQNNPQICAASDYCAVNAHAFFDANTAAQDAGTFVHNVLPTILNNGKPIIITESGWPYQGEANGLAIPSPANQATAIGSLKGAFGGNPGGLFLFQAYDAAYKAPGPYGVEQFFGIYGH